MLVHHANVQSVGVVGVFDLDLHAVFFNDARLGLVQPEQHAHQGRFARAVLAQQRVHLAFFQLQSDVVIRLDARELFGDVQHLNDILTHWLLLLFSPQSRGFLTIHYIFFYG